MTDSSANAIQLVVQLGRDTSIHDVRLSDLTTSLRRELVDLHFVTDVDQQGGVDQSNIIPPKGGKGGEYIALGAVLVAILPAAIPEIIGFLKEWALRPGNHLVKIKVQSRDDSMDIEFDPRSISKDEVMHLASHIKAQLLPRK